MLQLLRFHYDQIDGLLLCLIMVLALQEALARRVVLSNAQRTLRSPPGSRGDAVCPSSSSLWPVGPPAELGRQGSCVQPPAAAVSAPTVPSAGAGPVRGLPRSQPAGKDGMVGSCSPSASERHPVLGGKSTVLSPSLLSFQIDSWCKDNSYVIAGYYQANERVKDARYGNGQALGVGAQDPSLLGVLCEPLQAPDAQCGCTLLPTFCACL